MEKLKKHGILLAACVLIALLTVIYYQLTRYGTLIISGGIILRTVAFMAALFCISEITWILIRNWLKPMLEKGQTRKVYIIILTGCLVASAAVIIVFFLLRREHIGLLQIGIMVLGGILLFALFYCELLLAGAVLNRDDSKEKLKISTEKIALALICIVLSGFSFIPVISDAIHESYPYSSAPKTVVNVGWERDAYSIIGEITSEDEVCQTFRCTADTIHSITLNGATYMRENTSILQIRLVDMETDNVVESWNIDTHDLKDNSPFTIESKRSVKEGGMNGRMYKLLLTSEDATSGNAITLYYSTNNRNLEGTLYINNEEIDGDLIMEISGFAVPENFEFVRIWLCVYNMILAHVIVYFVHRKTSGRQKKAD